MHQKPITEEILFESSPQPGSFDAGRLYRSRDEILEDLVGTLNEVCDLLRSRAGVKSFDRSIEFHIALRKIQHDTEYLRYRLNVTLEM